MSNVIDFKSRQKLNLDSNLASNLARGETPAEIIDLTEKRSAIIASERRQVRRTILREFLSAFVLVPRRGLLKIDLYDISENGLSFDTDRAGGQYAVGEEIAMRVYLAQDTYFPFTVKIANVRVIEDEGTFRHGVIFQKESLNSDALTHFVRFIESVSASLQTDRGDIIASSIVR